ncbi:MAG: hypothetical protein K8W52_33815 [Deltaproteobacteria bacterium]|nr:hypothetical protein [Deltaproteobacteria bacterium]
MSMHIDHFGGSCQVGDAASLAATLAQRYGKDANEFWMGEHAGEYPCLALLVRGARASVHYFAESGHPGWWSRGVSESDALVEFFGQTPTAIQEIPEYAVVTLEEGLAAASEFFATGTMPTCIPWEEL